MKQEQREVASSRLSPRGPGSSLALRLHLPVHAAAAPQAPRPPRTTALRPPVPRGPQRGPAMARD